MTEFVLVNSLYGYGLSCSEKILKVMAGRNIRFPCLLRGGFVTRVYGTLM